jgi:hypothetical protein
MVIPRARLLPESFLLGVITILRAHGLPGVKLLEASTFLEAFLPGNLLTSLPAQRNAPCNETNLQFWNHSFFLNKSIKLLLIYYFL